MNTHEMPTKHSARRRGPIHRARILTLSNAHINFTEYVFPHYQICVSILHFVGVYIYAGTINRSPTAANGLPFRYKQITTTQRSYCYFGVNIKKGPHKWNPFNCKPSAITIANRLQQCHKHPRSIVFLQNTRASGALWF